MKKTLQGPLERCAAGSAGTVVRSLTDDCCLAVLLLSGREEAKAVLLGLRATLDGLAADAKDNLSIDTCAASEHEWCDVMRPNGMMERACYKDVQQIK